MVLATLLQVSKEFYSEIASYITATLEIGTLMLIIFQVLYRGGAETREGGREEERGRVCVLALVLGSDILSACVIHIGMASGP